VPFESIIAATSQDMSGDGGTDWALVLGIIGTGLAAIVALWNIYNAISARKALRKPDVHASMVIDGAGINSSIAFVNAGPALARHPTWLLIENSQVYQGGIGSAFLLPQGHVDLPLPFRSQEIRSTFVWGYMDVDGNVHVRSNSGERARYEHPARVELGEVFKRFYPDVPIPPQRPTLPPLGEKEA
jgi:hypothetical protein